MRTEDKLLILCARVRLGQPCREETARLLQGEDLDWEAVVAKARMHSLPLLLFDVLGRHFKEAVPARALEGARTLFLQNLKRCGKQSGTLLDLLSLFEAHGIRAVPFKGPVLAQLVYGDVAFRIFDDLDILVDPADVPRACALLADRGYEAEVPLTPKQLAAFVRQEQDLFFRSRDGRVFIELHWEISRRYAARPLTLRHYAPRLARAGFLGREVYALSTEDLLVYLCLHGTKHGWSRIEWSYCIAELLQRHPGIGWDQVLGLAREIRSERVLYLGLALAADLYRIDLPEGIAKRVASAPVASLVTRVKAALFSGRAGAAAGLRNRFSSFQLASRQSRADKLRYLARLAFRPTKKEWHSFPRLRPLSPLYYLLRPCVLVAERVGR